MKKYLVSLALVVNILLLVQCQQKAPVADAAKTEATTDYNSTDFGGYDTPAQWGEHLVNVSGCNDCHTPKKMGPRGLELDSSLILSGYQAAMPGIDKEVDRTSMEKKGLIVTRDLTAWVGPWGVSYAANLTPDPTGIGNWKEDNLKIALRQGKSKGIATSRSLLPPMPWEMFQHMSNQEISAIFAYLKSIKPIANNVPAPLPPATAAK